MFTRIPLSRPGGFQTLKITSYSILSSIKVLNFTWGATALTWSEVLIEKPFI